MRVIPVLDLLDGRVVQAIRGERERYRPVQSVLTTTGDPVQVGAALQAESRCEALYVADLDAIQGHGDHLDVLREMADELPVGLWVDAGVQDVEAAERLLDVGAQRVIVGSETLPSVAALSAFQRALPAERLVFSLDTTSGRVLSRAAELQGEAPFRVLEMLAGEGWSHIIVLTLHRVGTGTGPDWRLITSIRRRFPDRTLLTGGGIRSRADLTRLAELGVDGALVATALHRGWITRSDLQGLQQDRAASRPAD